MPKTVTEDDRLNTRPLGILRLTPNVAQALDRFCHETDRTRSAGLRLALKMFLRSRGYLIEQA